MRKTTLPFAPFALRELAEHWERQMDRATAWELDELRSRLCQVYVQIVNNDFDPDFRRVTRERLLSMLEAGPIEHAVLEQAADAAAEDDDRVLERQVLEALARTEDAEVRRRALERLGDFFDRIRDRGAAVDSWRSAARVLEDTHHECESARLYERMLDARPDDHEAAEKLVHLYADARDWHKLAEALGVVVRKDCQRAADLLLHVAPRAVTAGAHGELASMVDEVVVLLPSGSASARDLLRAKSRALASSAPPAQTSEAYRALLQAFGSDDDRREYEAHIASMSDALERHQERRWLYQWRAANDLDACEPLLAWAKEEEEQGEIEVAIGILRRVLAESPSCKDALEPLCRLALRTGDFAGALDALEALTDAAARDERPRFGQYVAPLLQTGARVIMTEPFDTSAELALFGRLVRIARELDQLDAVALWYGHALRGRLGDATLTDAIGRRFAALEGECSIDPSFFAETLEHVLDVVPGARWALDRVKLTLAAQARWDDFFRMIDRALETIEGARDRAELLEEAAFAARDVAKDARRATTYLSALCDERPGDVAATLALEHLYERQGRKLVLAEFLGRRAERAKVATRRELQRRIVTLRLELGDVEDASAMVDEMLDAGADVGALCEALEQLARHPGQERAADRLRTYYESIGHVADCIRLVEASLDRPTDDLRVAALTRDLVRLRVQAAAGAPGQLVRAAERVQQDAAKRPELAGTMHRALLIRAIAASKRAPTDADFADAVEGAWRALGAWTEHLLYADEVERACRVIRRGAGLPFERMRRRELLGLAAELSMDRLDDAPQAIRLLEEIFREDSADAVASGLVDRFARVLRAAGREDRVAILWEQQAGHQAIAGDRGNESARWRLAAEAWERAARVERAIAAYEHAAELGSEEAYEALARIHAEHGKWPEATAALEWLYVHAHASSRARHSLHLADAYLQLGRRDRARACLEQVLCAAPAAADADAVATMLVDLYRTDAAWRPLVDILAMLARSAADPQRSVALFREAASIVQSELQAPTEAAELLALAVASNPADASVRLELAQLLEILGQWSRAAEVLRDRIALFGEHRGTERAHLHHRLARALVRANDPAGAFAQLRMASKMRPRDPVILHDLAQAALEVGDFDLAEQTYRALLIALRHPTDASVSTSAPRVLLELAKIALLRGKTARAADLADSALQSALDAGEDPRPFERALSEMGRHDLLVSTLTHQLEWPGDVAARCGALRDLVEVWRCDLRQERELGTLLRRSARTLRGDLERERIADGAAWAALWSVHAALGEEASLLESGDRIVPLLHDALDSIDAAPDRARLRVALAAMLAPQPAHTEQATQLLSIALDEVDDAETARRIAQELEVLGSPRVADALERCITLDPLGVRYLAPRLATLREAQDDAAGVVRALEMLFAIVPEHGTAREDLPLLRRLVAAYETLGTDPEAIGLERMASLAVADGAWDRAAGYYTRMVRAWANPQEPADRKSLARGASRLLEACERTGRPGDAREPLEEARQRVPECSEVERALE
ncbi:MAG TPA: tetratricopeptide repeat protein, partial [Polyangiaceae bacterium]|nr:tetratricopeptide repeat protein [Polyangiaceae bacterium]